VGAGRARWPSSDGDTVRLAILVGAQIVGFIQYHEDTSAEFKHAGVDLFLDPSVHRQGLGRESIDLVVRHLIGNLGHHRIVIDPAAANEAAIRCYESLGFRPVGIMREYWWDHTQDAWTDGLLLDLLASEVLR
jgi:aminoglycoside 6'-N-acetyltransferase